MLVVSVFKNEYSHWKIQNVCVSLCRSTHMQSWANTQETKLIWFSVTWLLLQRCWESTSCPQGDKTGQIAHISSSRLFVILVCSFKSDFSTPVLWGEWRGRRQQTEKSEWEEVGAVREDNMQEVSEQQGGERENTAKTNTPSWKPASPAESKAFPSFQHTLVVIALLLFSL